MTLRHVWARLYGWWKDRNPTDAEIVARARQHAMVDLPDVGMGLFLRFGSWCSPMQAMPMLRGVGSTWRELARKALQQNNMAASDEQIDAVLQHWYLADLDVYPKFVQRQDTVRRTFVH